MTRIFKSRCSAKRNGHTKASLARSLLKHEVEKEITVMSIAMPFLPKDQVRGIVQKKLGLESGSDGKTLLRKGGGRIDYKNVTIKILESQSKAKPAKMESPRKIRKKLLGHSHRFRIVGRCASQADRKEATEDDTYGFLEERTPTEQVPKFQHRVLPRPHEEKQNKRTAKKKKKIFSCELKDTLPLGEDEIIDAFDSLTVGQSVNPATNYRKSGPKKHTTREARPKNVLQSRGRNPVQQVSELRESVHRTSEDTPAMNTKAQSIDSPAGKTLEETDDLADINLAGDMIESSDDEAVGRDLGMEETEDRHSERPTSPEDISSVDKSVLEQECVKRWNVSPTPEDALVPDEEELLPDAETFEVLADFSMDADAVPSPSDAASTSLTPPEYRPTPDSSTSLSPYPYHGSHRGSSANIESQSLDGSYSKENTQTKTNKGHHNSEASAPETSMDIPVSDIHDENGKSRSVENRASLLSSSPRKDLAPTPSKSSLSSNDGVIQRKQDPVSPTFTSTLGRRSTKDLIKRQKCLSLSLSKKSSHCDVAKQRNGVPRNISPKPAGALVPAEEQLLTDAETCEVLEDVSMDTAAVPSPSDAASTSVTPPEYNPYSPTLSQYPYHASQRGSSAIFSTQSLHGSYSKENAQTDKAHHNSSPSSVQVAYPLEGDEASPLDPNTSSMESASEISSYDHSVRHRGGPSAIPTWLLNDSVMSTPRTSRPYRGPSTKKGIPWTKQVPVEKITGRRALFSSTVTLFSAESTMKEPSNSQENVFMITEKVNLDENNGSPLLFDSQTTEETFNTLEDVRMRSEEERLEGKESPQLSGSVSEIESPTRRQHGYAIPVTPLLLRKGADRLDGLPFSSGEAVRPAAAEWLHQKNLNSQEDSTSAKTPSVPENFPSAQTRLSRSKLRVLVSKQDLEIRTTNHADLTIEATRTVNSPSPFIQSRAEHSTASSDISAQKSVAWWQEDYVLDALSILGVNEPDGTNSDLFPETQPISEAFQQSSESSQASSVRRNTSSLLIGQTSETESSSATTRQSILSSTQASSVRRNTSSLLISQTSETESSSATTRQSILSSTQASSVRRNTSFLSPSQTSETQPISETLQQSSESSQASSVRRNTSSLLISQTSETESSSATTRQSILSSTQASSVRRNTSFLISSQTTETQPTSATTRQSILSSTQASSVQRDTPILLSNQTLETNQRRQPLPVRKATTQTSSVHGHKSVLFREMDRFHRSLQQSKKPFSLSPFKKKNDRKIIF